MLVWTMGNQLGSLCIYHTMHTYLHTLMCMLIINNIQIRSAARTENGLDMTDDTCARAYVWVWAWTHIFISLWHINQAITQSILPTNLSNCLHQGTNCSSQQSVNTMSRIPDVPMFGFIYGLRYKYVVRILFSDCVRDLHETRFTCTSNSSVIHQIQSMV